MWTEYLHVPRTKGRDVITNFNSKSPLSLAARLGLSLSLFIKHSIYLSDEISSIQRTLNNREVRFEGIISVSVDRDSVDGVATAYGLDGPGIESR